MAVNVWYHVGSKNEKPGKTGFAHLFEHLMFNGSENFNDDYFKALEKLGATDLNGTTNDDRTNYFQNVPTTALDTVLWMESDRMGHLLGAIDQAQARRAARRGAEREAPGREPALRPGRRGADPEGHLSRRATRTPGRVIGSMEDLNAASLDDVQGVVPRPTTAPPTPSLVVAGDVDTAEAVQDEGREVLRRHPAGPAGRAARRVDRQAHRRRSAR